MEALVRVLELLTVCIIVLVALIVWRDRRELKLKQISLEIKRVEDILNNFYQNKQELDKIAESAKRYTDAAISQLEGQIMQIKNALTHLEQRLPLLNTNTEKKEAKERDKNHKTQSKGKSRGNRESKHQGQKGEAVRINDGEKYARICELAEKGMSLQEIAKKLNLSTDEVELALELKGKKLS